MNRQKRAEILQQQAAVQTKLSDAAQEQAVLFTANVANVWDAVEKAAKEERIAAARVCNTFTTFAHMQTDHDMLVDLNMYTCVCV